MKNNIFIIILYYSLFSFGQKIPNKKELIAPYGFEEQVTSLRKEDWFCDR